MRTRQFRQLAGMGTAKRLPFLEAGLTAIGANVQQLAAEHDECVRSGARRSAQLVRNVAREEAGKFLILIDAARCPAADQGLLSDHFNRAGVHLAKLIYAQIADYSIATQEELLGAVESHRHRLRLDGPNDFDWIFPNQLITERESALYVDLVEDEEGLDWSAPHDVGGAVLPSMCGSVRLVMAVTAVGLTSVAGMLALADAWDGFDPHTDSHCTDWAERTALALAATQMEEAAPAPFVVDRWPMPMVELDISEVKVTVDDLRAERDALAEAWWARQYGYDTY
jgi:AbiV family abortive infection protein